MGPEQEKGILGNQRIWKIPPKERAGQGDVCETLHMLQTNKQTKNSKTLRNVLALDHHSQKARQNTQPEPNQIDRLRKSKQKKQTKINVISHRDPESHNKYSKSPGDTSKLPQCLLMSRIRTTKTKSKANKKPDESRCNERQHIFSSYSDHGLWIACPHRENCSNHTGDIRVFLNISHNAQVCMPSTI